MLATVGDGVFLVDLRGDVRLWNSFAAEAITGLAASGARWQSPLTGGDSRWGTVCGTGDRCRTDAGRGRAQRGDTSRSTFDGRELWLSISGVGFSDGTVYAFRDLTDERRVEQLKTEFVATASHELRTPLAAVYGAAMTLRRPDVGSDPAVQAQLFAVIAEESDRLARTINDILWASKLESGQLEMSIESFDIAGELAASDRRGHASLHFRERLDLNLSAEPGPLPPVAARSRTRCARF